MLAAQYDPIAPVFGLQKTLSFFFSVTGIKVRGDEWSRSHESRVFALLDLSSHVFEFPVHWVVHPTAFLSILVSLAHRFVRSENRICYSATWKRVGLV